MNNKIDNEPKKTSLGMSLQEYGNRCVSRLTFNTYPCCGLRNLTGDTVCPNCNPLKFEWPTNTWFQERLRGVANE